MTTDAYQLAADLLECLRQRLALTWPEGPKNVCQWPANSDSIPLDDCCAGQAWTVIRRIYPTQFFPGDAEGDFKCDNWRLVADIEVGVARCAPTMKTQGLRAVPPGCDEQQTVAAQLAEDMMALWCALLDCSQVWQAYPWSRSVQLREIVPLAVSGGCMGAQTLVSVELGGCQTCG